MFKTAKLLAPLWLALAAHAAEWTRLRVTTKSRAVWTRPGLRFIIFGEMHGTTETPASFADLICSAPENKRPIIVGIELHDQHALDIFMAASKDPPNSGTLIDRRVEGP